MIVLQYNDNKDYQNSTATYIMKTRTFCEDSYNISDVLILEIQRFLYSAITIQPLLTRDFRRRLLGQRARNTRMGGLV